jgi:predicted TIM-barrel fold metal-dependent hydrolase
VTETSETTWNGPEWLISVDDHILEPPHLWVDRVPAKLADAVPHLVRDGDEEAWVYEGKSVATTGLSAVVGRESYSPEPVTYAEMRTGCYDPKARADDMTEAGVLAQLNFPSVPRFCGQTFLEAKDKEVALLGVQAWNDFVLDEWCDAAPGRFIPAVIVPLWDPQLMVKEVERTAAKGAKGILFSENPSKLGLPSIHDEGRYWDPLLAAASDADLPLCAHTGSSSRSVLTSSDAPTIIGMTATPVVNGAQALFDWLFSGQFLRHPNLKLALSEGGIGWIPYALMWADHAWKAQEWAHDSDVEMSWKDGKGIKRNLANKLLEQDQLPSALFRQHIYGCFIEDNVGLRLLDLLGEDNVMIETDYPHSDGTWPSSLEVAKRELAHLTTEQQQKIMIDNACRLYNFTPATMPSR